MTTGICPPFSRSRYRRRLNSLLGVRRRCGLLTAPGAESSCVRVSVAVPRLTAMTGLVLALLVVPLFIDAQMVLDRSGRERLLDPAKSVQSFTVGTAMYALGGGVIAVWLLVFVFDAVAHSGRAAGSAGADRRGGLRERSDTSPGVARRRP